MRLNPYLHFTGKAEEALNFYVKALGGKILMIQRYGDSPMPSDESQKDKLMHGRMEFDGNVVMLSDVFHGEEISSNGNVQMSVEVESIDRINDVFKKMSEGGKVTMELQDMFWGARFGMLEDKFGIRWMFNHQLPK